MRRVRRWLSQILCSHRWGPYDHLGGGIHEKLCRRCGAARTLDTR
jgi:hypothetical protein